MPSYTFKTITQETFVIDFETSTTVETIKQEIAKRGDAYAADLQKIIYNGKVLDDAATIESAGIDPAKFVVVMLSRRKPTEAAPTAAPAAAAKPTPEPTPAPTVAAPAAPATEARPTTTTAPSQAAPAARQPAAEPQLTDAQRSSVDALTGMGFTRQQALSALEVAAWNADRAAEFLLSGGLPEELDMGGQGGGGGGISDSEGEDLDASMQGAAGGNVLDALRDLPQIEEIRNMVRNNPQMLPQLMQVIAQTNPDLLQAIQGNQEAFLAMLNSAGGGAGAGGASGARNDDGPEIQQLPDGRQAAVIRLTESEMAAVNRIKAMGFRVPEQLIVEAFIACDKNEQMAIEYILNRMEEGD